MTKNNNKNRFYKKINFIMFLTELQKIKINLIISEKKRKYKKKMKFNKKMRRKKIKIKKIQNNRKNFKIGEKLMTRNFLKIWKKKIYNKKIMKKKINKRIFYLIICSKKIKNILFKVLNFKLYLILKKKN